MKNFYTLSMFLGILILTGCNNFGNLTTDPSLINAPIAEVRYRNQNTLVVQMSRVGNSLHLTGSPFGYMIWSLVNPESPALQFAAADNIAAFSTIGFWRLDYLASAALIAWDRFAAMSGNMGASLVSTVNGTSAGQEVWRQPVPDQYGGATRDLAWVYSAMARDPQSGTVYGLTPDEFIYLINANTQSLTLRSRYRYSPTSTVCCAKGAAVFSNNLFVGMGSKLVIYPVQSGGALGTPIEFAGLQANRIVATDTHLYVLHLPSNAYPQGQSRAAGVYIIDATGRITGYLPITTPVFEVYEAAGSGNYIYAADANSVKIYKFQ